MPATFSKPRSGEFIDAYITAFETVQAWTKTFGEPSLWDRVLSAHSQLSKISRLLRDAGLELDPDILGSLYAYEEVRNQLLELGRIPDTGGQEYLENWFNMRRACAAFAERG